MITYFNHFNKDAELKAKYILSLLESRANLNKEEKARFFNSHKFILNYLKGKDREILSRYFGLNGEMQTFKQIANDLNYTGANASSRFDDIMRKLRHPLLFRALEMLTDIDYQGLQDFSREKLAEFLDKVASEREQKRFESLPTDEKIAQQYLDQLLEVRFNMLFLSARTNELFKPFTTVEQLLQISNEQFHNKDYQELVDRIHGLGLYFCCEFEYEEDWKNACKQGIAKKGFAYSQGFISATEKRATKQFNMLIQTPVEKLFFSVGLTNSLKRAGIDTVADIILRSEKEWYKVKGIGATGLNEIYKKIISLGLDLCPANNSKTDWLVHLAKKFGAVVNIKQLDEGVDGDKKFRLLLSTPVNLLNFGFRTYNCIMRTGATCLEDIVARKESEWAKARGIGELVLAEIKEKVKEKGLDLCPEDMDSKKWIEHLAIKYATKYDEKIKKQRKATEKYDINEIPEKYRETYALGAMLKAQQDSRKLTKGDSLVVRAINSQPTNNVVADKKKVSHFNCDKSIKYVDQERMFEIIKNDIASLQSIFDDLTEEFILNYNKELSDILWEDKTLPVEIRFAMLNKIHDIVKANEKTKK